MDVDGIHIFSQEEMDELAAALAMPPSALYRQFPQEEMNRLTAYCRAFDEYEREILALTGASLTEVLLSKYYWRGRMEALAGHRADFAQYTFQALEELERLENIDWPLVERLDRDIKRGCGLEG